MPSSTLYVADTGYLADYNSVVGASQAWQALDDEPNDGDTSYVRFNAAASASFRIVQMGLADLLPTAVHLFAYSRVNLSGAPGTGPTVAVGFVNVRHDLMVGTAQELTATYLIKNDVLMTNPFTGAAWRRGDLAGLELAFSVVTLPVPTRHVRLTQLGMTIDYGPRMNWEKN